MSQVVKPGTQVHASAALAGTRVGDGRHGERVVRGGRVVERGGWRERLGFVRSGGWKIGAVNGSPGIGSSSFTGASGSAPRVRRQRRESRRASRPTPHEHGAASARLTERTSGVIGTIGTGGLIGIARSVLNEASAGGWVF